MFRKVASVSLIALVAAAALAAEMVGVSGSDTQYASEIEATVAGKSVPMTLTGAALRKKLFFNVYTVGSYAQQGAGIRTADELAERDCPKQLHLILERDVKGADMAAALQTAVRANYDDPQYANELKALVEFMGKIDIKKGDNVRLTHIPKRGLQVDVEGKAQIVIETPSFSKAVWDIYLGKNNVGEAIKTALVSRL